MKVDSAQDLLNFIAPKIDLVQYEYKSEIDLRIYFDGFVMKSPISIEIIRDSMALEKVANQKLKDFFRQYLEFESKREEAPPAT